MQALAAILIWQAGARGIRVRSLAGRCLLLFCLLTMLRSILIRNPLMDAVVTTAWLYSFIDNLTALAPYLVLACLTAWLAPRLTRVWLRVAGAVVFAALAYLVFAPLFTWAFTPVLGRLSFLRHQAVYLPPYDWHVLVPAYATFLEPVTASVVVAAIVWDALAGPSWAKLAQFAVLLMCVDEQFFRPLVYAATSPAGAERALVSASQFWIEALVLALLSAGTWMFSRRRIAG